MTCHRGLCHASIVARPCVLQCVECGAISDTRARGWAGYRCDDPETDEPPALAFYCPACASAEFGDRHPLIQGEGGA